MPTTATFRQDMPPKGGYQAVDWMQKIPKKPLSGLQMFSLYMGVTVFGWTCYYFELKKKQRERVEMDDARFAVQPLMMAEMDRMYMTKLRENREEEGELMKDVPGWEVGKWNGKPLFHKPGPNQINLSEYYAHSQPVHHFKRLQELRQQ